jgi:sigma-B regulation protein RsbU (phosphoserine phosphatase)
LIIDKDIALQRTATWAAAIFAGAQLLFLLFSTPLALQDEQALDRFIALRAATEWAAPPYDGVVVHVDLNNTSLRMLNDPHIDRGHHARLIHNLAAMKTAAIMYDFVFAGASAPPDDRELISAVRQAGNVFVGMVFRLGQPGSPDRGLPADEKTQRLLDLAAWRIPVALDGAGFFRGMDPIATFADLSAVSRGIGYLSLNPDKDGVFRRIPLLVRHGDAFFPSFALRVVCDFLGVPPERVALAPGKIVLRDAAYPGRNVASHLVIPVDARGNLRINFLGPWGAMTHYHFADVYRASQDADAMEVWREELAGRIVLVSDICTGSADVGQVPTDPDFPLSGIHANTVNTLLSGAFLREIGLPWNIAIELGLLLAVTALSCQRSAFLFTLGSLGLAGGYVFLVGAFLFLGSTLLPVVRPLLLTFGAMFGLLIVSAIENARSHAATEKAREVAERDLEIGRQIQAGFLPKDLPSPAGWEIATHFKPARQVAGDFYDVFALGNSRYIVLVIADVCDKGVGAALFMALVRSLVRALTTQGFADLRPNPGAETAGLDRLLLRTVAQTNQYIATTHGDSNMFATLLLGLLEPASGALTYVNCGHEPPLVLAAGEVTARLKATGPAVGIMPDAPYRTAQCRLAPGDLLLAYTDGVTDAVNASGELYSRERLTALVTQPAHNAADLLSRVNRDIAAHTAGFPQADDITMLAIRRGAQVGSG